MRPADPSAFAISVGSYELLEGVGSDAVSELWLARTVNEPRRVLRLARLKREAISDTESREAFLTSMRKAATRDSPLLLRVMAVGAEGDDVYAAVEHVEGLDLDALLSVAREGGEMLSAGIAVRIVLDVIAALDVLGTPHGDLTPAAIHITAGGITLLSPVSFAVAACHAPREGVLRRLAYKAPEQLAESGRHAGGSPRADVFALGAILYEMLTGQPLVGGMDGRDIARALPSALPPDTDDLPVPLAKVVKKALAREAAERYRGPDEMAEALERAVPELLADRYQMAGSFWHLAGNDLAARRFELESLMQGATDVAVEEARRSSEFPPARLAEEVDAAGAGHAGKAEAEAEGAAEAEAGAEGAAEAEAGAGSAAEAEAGAGSAAEAEAKAPPTEPERKERRAVPKRRPIERDEPPVVRRRSIPPERAQQTRRVVTGLVIGAALVLGLAIVVRSGHHSDAPKATPDTAATHAAPPAKPRASGPAPVVTKPDLPATNAPEPPATSAPEPPAANAPEPPAAAPEQAPSQPAANVAARHRKKKHKHAAAAKTVKAKTAAAKAATAAPAPSAAPPVKHVASFGALPPAPPAPPPPKQPPASGAPVPTAPF